MMFRYIYKGSTGPCQQGTVAPVSANTRKKGKMDRKPRRFLPAQGGISNNIQAAVKLRLAARKTAASLLAKRRLSSRKTASSYSQNGGWLPAKLRLS
jgi:hypothetical protein